MKYFMHRVYSTVGRIQRKSIKSFHGTALSGRDLFLPVRHFDTWMLVLTATTENFVWIRKIVPHAVVCISPPGIKLAGDNWSVCTCCRMLTFYLTHQESSGTNDLWSHLLMQLVLETWTLTMIRLLRQRKRWRWLRNRTYGAKRRCYAGEPTIWGSSGWVRCHRFRPWFIPKFVFLCSMFALLSRIQAQQTEPVASGWRADLFNVFSHQFRQPYSQSTFRVALAGETQEEHIALPRDLTTFQNRRVKDIGCGQHHTLFVMQDGTVYSCGNNDHGQLGRENSSKTPGESHAIVFRWFEPWSIHYV